MFRSRFLVGFIVVSFFTPFLSQGKSKIKKPKKTVSWQTAVVKIEGAMIYESPSFDSKVIAYVSKDERIKISLKTYGPFYKTKMSKTKFGYISDVDITPSVMPHTSSNQSSSKKSKKDNDTKPTKEANRPPPPVMETQFVGPVISFLNYTSKFDDSNFSSPYTFYGIKVSGPDLLFKGPILTDLVVALSPTPPNYFTEDFQAQLAKGVAFLLETSLDWPFSVFGNGMIYGGVGLHLMYADYDLTFEVSNRQKVTFTNLGLTASLGLMYRINKVGLRIEPHGYYDPNGTHLAFQLAIQYAYF